MERIKNDTVLKDVKTYLERTLDRFYQTRDIKVLGEKLFQITFQNDIDYNDNNNDDDDYNVVVVDDYNHNVDVNDDEHSNMVGLFLYVIYYITYYILYIVLHIFYVLHYIQFQSFLWMSKTSFDLLTRHLQKKSKLYCILYFTFYVIFLCIHTGYYIPYIPFIILKGGRYIMSTFNKVVHIPNVYILFLPPFILYICIQHCDHLIHC